MGPYKSVFGLRIKLFEQPVKEMPDVHEQIGPHGGPAKPMVSAFKNTQIKHTRYGIAGKIGLFKGHVFILRAMLDKGWCRDFAQGIGQVSRIDVV
jgi:hypothetical protein